MMRKPAEVVGIVASVLVSLGCSGSSSSSLSPDAPSSDGPGHTPGMPGLGAHGMSTFHLGANAGVTSIATPAMTTQTSGSVIVVAVGRGKLEDFGSASAAPTDNKGNAPYPQLGSTQKYTNWPSGTAIYALPAAHGGSNHTITTARPMDDEVTLSAVEVIEGSRIQAIAWNQPERSPLTSNTVTTTGPATLIAYWWGDGFPGTPQSATPNNGFQVIESNAQERDSFVQSVVAVKNVAAAGTYDVTWTPTPEQGAQLWLIAVQ